MIEELKAILTYDCESTMLVINKSQAGLLEWLYDHDFFAEDVKMTIVENRDIVDLT